MAILSMQQRIKLAYSIQAPAPIKAVLACLAYYASGRTALCWPAHASIARNTGLSRATVQRALDALRAASAISWRSQGQHQPALYHVAWPIIAHARGLTVRYLGPSRGLTLQRQRAHGDARTGRNGDPPIDPHLPCHLCGKRPSISDSPGSTCWQCASGERALLRKQQRRWEQQPSPLTTPMSSKPEL